ncbi:UPF0223 family protein [Pediococcus acidilactici]|uniref:UPF0223 family protein n=1 Tax=Pediococcus acidilactici TaxID=1254 RepID=UPI0006B49F24|nr:UPF0223 family protein [Pediococcus acidilactici]KAF0373071.1 hypothetical protein GBO58_02225 [Pediococcus acidilactici]KAF0383736.1 hypothetical protein GBO62_03020 [Pediococcus acidilactici]KAF0457722.1 hypothetical protein GBP02_03020 [Pediococcus acidilactici]KAF0476843.1 hypothetical protein GBP10_02440 [Pediococcus acidilactici]KAF0537369.1 hypothetical protein GBP37_02450 [Pediococcus acidilactici]
MGIKENFSYPLDERWNVQEITDVVDFFTKIEESYQKGVKNQTLKNAYDKFRQVVPNKSEEKRIYREFEQNSGMQPFQAVKQLRDEGVKIIKVTENGYH